MNNKIIGLIALIGITIVGIGEWLLLFNPAGGYDFTTYTFLQGKSYDWINYGHWLSVLAAPAYFLAYYHISQNLKRHQTKFLMWAIYTFSLAAMWISSRSYLALTAQEANHEKFIELISGHADPLLFIVWGLLLILSISFSYLVWTGQSKYPRWFAAFNPITILASVFLLYFLIPAVGTYILPTAMNITHLVFVGLSVWLTRR